MSIVPPRKTPKKSMGPIARWMDSLGLHVPDIAGRIGAGINTVYKWRQGKAYPDARHLEVIKTVYRNFPEAK